MKLSSYINPNFIITNIKSENKKDIIEEMINEVALRDKLFMKNKNVIENAVIKRENEISTAMGNSIMIPHARIDGYNDIIIAIGILKNPFTEYIRSIKKEDTIKVVFLLVGDTLKNKIMLKLMSGISKLILKNKNIILEICNNLSANNIYEKIKKANIEIENTLIASDIMDTSITPADPSDTLDEIATRFVVEGKIGLPVVYNMKFLGEITERELIRYGMPKYTSVMKNLSFMTIGEPFEEYLKNEKRVTVSDIYRKKDIITVDRKAPIMEICFIMVDKGNTRIYVVEDGIYYGTIIRSHIIQKILHN